MRKFQVFLWILMNILFLSQLIGLYFECLNKGFSFWYLALGIVLVICVNTTIAFGE